MPVGECSRDGVSRIELDPVPLIVVDGERNDRKAALARHSRAHHRIETAGEEDHRLLHGGALRRCPPAKEGPPILEGGAAQLSGSRPMGGKRAKSGTATFLAQIG